MKYLYFVTVLILVSACEEEIVFPNGSEMLPGIYEGRVVWYFGGQEYINDDFNAIVEHIDKNRYTIEFDNLNLLELPVFEIRISEVATDTWINFDILNEGCNSWGTSFNHFIIYHANTGLVPKIDLTLNTTFFSDEKTLLFQFGGQKPL